MRLYKPPIIIVNQQCVVYSYKCDLCDAGYVSYTRQHLHQRVEEHIDKRSAIYEICLLNDFNLFLTPNLTLFVQNF